MESISLESVNFAEFHGHKLYLPPPANLPPVSLQESRGISFHTSLKLSCLSYEIYRPLVLLSTVCEYGVFHTYLAQLNVISAS